MPSSDPAKRREQQRLRRRRAVDAPATAQSAPPQASGCSGGGGDEVGTAPRSDVVAQQGDVSASVDECLRDATPLAQRFHDTVAVNISPRNLRAVAAALYQRRHGGTFPQVQQLFRLDDGSIAFSRPTFTRFRELLNNMEEGSYEMLYADVARRVKRADAQALSRKRELEAVEAGDERQRQKRELALTEDLRRKRALREEERIFACIDERPDDDLCKRHYDAFLLAEARTRQSRAAKGDKLAAAQIRLYEMHTALLKGDIGIVPSGLPLDWDVAFFEDAGYDNQIRRETLLSAAVRLGRVESVKLLLSAGASPNVHDYEGITPLSWAGELDDGECCALMVEALLESGADANLRDVAPRSGSATSGNKYSPLEALLYSVTACDPPETQRLKLRAAELLCAHGADASQTIEHNDIFDWNEGKSGKYIQSALRIASVGPDEGWNVALRDQYLRVLHTGMKRST
jgi:hypothetical protein